MWKDPNYPDDIRNYDNDPRSPFYDEPETYSSCCKAEAEEWEKDECICPECGEYCEYIELEEDIG